MLKASIIFDRKKLTDIIYSKGMTPCALAEELGYYKSSLHHALNRQTLTRSMWVGISQKLGITLDDIAPDPEPEPIPAPVEESEPEIPSFNRNDPSSEHWSLFNDEELEILNMFSGKIDQVIELLRQSRKTVSEETIAQGVRWGMEMFYTDHKKDVQDLILKNVKGAIFSGNLEALKKHDELLDMRDPYREFIAPVNNGRPD